MDCSAGCSRFMPSYPSLLTDSPLVLNQALDLHGRYLLYFGAPRLLHSESWPALLPVEPAPGIWKVTEDCKITSTGSREENGPQPEPQPDLELSPELRAPLELQLPPGRASPLPPAVANLERREEDEEKQRLQVQQPPAPGQLKARPQQGKGARGLAPLQELPVRYQKRKHPREVWNSTVTALCLDA
mmetsp:Transcript_87920/g.188595  ORF Transcript_87920/g.188595 Transcript_87920/m.188595 type:complete len:187 (-) Transcript_87920:268-828(-)